MFPESTDTIDGYALLKLAAVERLLADEDHWCKGALRDGNGRFCLLGALDVAGARHLLEPVMLRAVREVSGKRYWRVESFNDDRRTTHPDILRVLDCAREQVASRSVPLGYAEPWSRRCGQAVRAFCARTASAIKPHLGRMTGGFGRLAPQPVPVPVSTAK
ncbi:MAG TPA: hypothetical protein VJ770_02395 [Stellaceae bacterium]|nr:hypothetical protein [Stellaceae bacterium]